MNRIVNKSLQTKPNRKEQVKKVLLDLFSEYSSNATIHGISYFTDNNRRWFERLFWVIGFVFSATVCIYLICKTWIKWKENPVIVSFAQEHSPIWEIPFPAVTICPLNKINQYDFNYTQAYQIVLKEKIPESIMDADIDRWEEYFANMSRIFFNVSLICDVDMAWIGEATQGFFTTDEAVHLIRSLAPKMKETLTNVMWQDKEYTMDSKEFLFHEQVTSEGLCFTFNALRHSDMYTDQVKSDNFFVTHNKTTTGWSVEKGYKDKSFANSYPMRTFRAGIKFGLSTDLLIAPHQREGYCGDAVAGFKVLLHNPGEIPRLTEQYFLAPAKQQVTVAVTPKLIRTSQNLANLKPNDRNCYFVKEKKLKFFKIYTQYNCRIECEANITKVHCDCLPFYLPRDGNTKICGLGRKQCLTEVKGQVYKFENVKKNQKDITDEQEKRELKIFQECQCLSSCYSLEYEVELSQAEYLHEMSKNQIANSSSMEITPFNVFFKESQFLALDRSELYGQTDFIANVGGLLGLFVGFSFLSFLEIIYYLTLRMWCKLYNMRKVENRPPNIPQIAWIN